MHNWGVTLEKGDTLFLIENGKLKIENWLTAISYQQLAIS